MNFIISDLGSADLETIQSANLLDTLRVREQDAARDGWVLMEINSSQLYSCVTCVNIATYCCIALAFCVSDFLDAAY